MEDTPQSIAKVAQVITLFEEGSVDRVSGTAQAMAALTAIDNLIPFRPLQTPSLGQPLIPSFLSSFLPSFLPPCLPPSLPPSMPRGIELIDLWFSYGGWLKLGSVFWRRPWRNFVTFAWCSLVLINSTICCRFLGFDFPFTGGDFWFLCFRKDSLNRHRVRLTLPDL